GTELRVALTDIGTPNSAAAGTPPQPTQLLTSLVFRWRHDLGNFWVSQLEAGVMEIMRARDGGGRIWQPTGAASIRYAKLFGQAELQYRHLAQANVFVGQTFITDQILLSGAIPLGSLRSPFSLSLGGGYSHGRLVDVNMGSLPNSVDLIEVDTALIWRPNTHF